MNRIFPISLAILCMISLSCDEGSMTNNGRVKPHEPVGFFTDGNSARPLVEGAVSRDAPFAAAIPDDFPFAITRRDLVRGQESDPRIRKRTPR